MSLREEIKDIYINNRYKGNQEYYLSDDGLIGLIISAFEKRIDSRIEYLSNEKKNLESKGYASSVLEIIQTKIDELGRVKEVLK